MVTVDVEHGSDSPRQPRGVAAPCLSTHLSTWPHTTASRGLQNKCGRFHAFMWAGGRKEAVWLQRATRARNHGLRPSVTAGHVLPMMSQGKTVNAQVTQAMLCCFLVIFLQGTCAIYFSLSLINEETNFLGRNIFLTVFLRTSKKYLYVLTSSNKIFQISCTMLASHPIQMKY